MNVLLFVSILATSQDSPCVEVLQKENAALRAEICELKKAKKPPACTTSIGVVVGVHQRWDGGPTLNIDDRYFVTLSPECVVTIDGRRVDISAVATVKYKEATLSMNNAIPPRVVKAGFSSRKPPKRCQ
jgi:hypothetical protein